MKKTLLRIGADILLVAGLFLFPWWVWLVLAFASVATIDRHYELVVLGVLADAAYRGGSSLMGGHFFFLAATTFFVVISVILKPRLKFYTSG